MTIKYCLPIIKNTKDEVLQMIDTHFTEYQYFEVWLDYIEDLDNKVIEHIVDTLHERAIFLLRRQSLEPIHMAMDARKNVLKKLEKSESFIDLDISTQQEELAFVKQSNIHVETILSFHDYEKTPTKEELTMILENMKLYNPAIYKIATLCKTEENALQLLELLLQWREQGKKYIILGMGEKGSITRIFGTLWGNEMVFAPMEKTESSAPGQLKKTDLATILTILNH